MDFHGATESDITSALDALKMRLAMMFGRSITKLVLFGSRARGDYDTTSDIDIAIVVKDLDAACKNRIIDMVADIELEFLVPLSTLVLSEENYSSLLMRERRIAMDIEREGIPI